MVPYNQTNDVCIENGGLIPKSFDFFFVSFFPKGMNKLIFSAASSK